MSELPLIHARGLCKYFEVPRGMLHAVDGINLTIFPGKTLGVVGESGCGKSTLGRILLRLLEPTEGEILYDGEDIVSYNNRTMKAMRKNMQMIFQDPYSSLNPRMVVADLIAEYMIINKIYPTRQEIYEQVHDLMDRVGLSKRLYSAYPHELDGGRRQRVGVARALSLNPRFIVCDEPVSALDVSIQAQILNLLMDLQQELHLTYMFVSHNLAVVKHISDEIMVMYLGQCVERAPSKELFANPMHPYTKVLLSAIPAPRLSMRSKEIQTIKGEITSPVNPKPGCRFANRCEHTREVCFGEDPPFKEYGTGHFAACRLLE